MELAVLITGTTAVLAFIDKRKPGLLRSSDDGRDGDEQSRRQASRR